MGCNTLCANAYHNNAESLISFAPGTIPLAEQLEPYTQEYLEPNVLTTLLGEQTITAAGNIQEALTGINIGDKFLLGYIVKDVPTGAQLTEDAASLFGGATLVYTEGRQYIVELTASTTKLQLNNPGTADIVLDDIQLRKVSQHHKNLVINGGLPYGTDWINPTSGLAEGWTKGGVSTVSSIVTGNGFNGNAQRLEYTGVGEITGASLNQSIALATGETLRIRLKVRVNIGFRIIMIGDSVSTLLTKVDTSEVVQSYDIEFTSLDNKTGISFYIGNDNTLVTGEYIEVDEILIWNTADPGFDLYHYRAFQDWPANVALPDVGIGNYTAKRELTPIEKEWAYKIKKIGIDLS